MVNISQPKKITMNKFATEIIKLTATSIKVIHLHLPKDNSKQKISYYRFKSFLSEEL
jgi:hypothetical protein